MQYKRTTTYISNTIKKLKYHKALISLTKAALHDVATLRCLPLFIPEKTHNYGLRRASPHTAIRYRPCCNYVLIFINLCKVDPIYLGEGSPLILILLWIWTQIQRSLATRLRHLHIPDLELLSFTTPSSSLFDLGYDKTLLYPCFP